MAGAHHGVRLRFLVSTSRSVAALPRWEHPLLRQRWRWQRNGEARVEIGRPDSINARATGLVWWTHSGPLTRNVRSDRKTIPSPVRVSRRRSGVSMSVMGEVGGASLSKSKLAWSRFFRRDWRGDAPPKSQRAHQIEWSPNGLWA